MVGGGGVLWPSARGVLGRLPPSLLSPPSHSSSHSRVPDLVLTCMPCACTSVRSARTSVRSVCTSVRSVKEEEGCRGHSLKVPGKDSMEPQLWPALKVVLRGRDMTPQPSLGTATHTPALLPQRHPRYREEKSVWPPAATGKLCLKCIFKNQKE